MLKKLRIKFICFNMAIVTIMLCVIFGLVLGITRNNYKNQSLQQMRQAADGPRAPGMPEQPLSRTRLPYLILQVNSQGEVTSASSALYDVSDEALLKNLAEAALDSRSEDGVIKEYSLRFCFVSTPSGRRIVFADISAEQHALRNLLHTCLLIGAVSFLLFLAISIILARWAVKPVDLAWQQQRQFVSDASHELKTPLTVILANAQMLHSPDYDEQTRRQFSHNILTMAQQMRGLVESLLELARVDNGSVRQSMSAMNFSALIENVLLPFEPIYFEKGLTINSRIQEDIYIRGDENYIRQLTGILLDNARKYTYPSSEITIRLERQGRRHCLLLVANPGEEISAADQKNIFRRFYRADTARSMDHSYGLGLSIAQSIVSRHGGKIWCESTDGINSFFVKLPAVYCK